MQLHMWNQVAMGVPHKRIFVLMLIAQDLIFNGGIFQELCDYEKIVSASASTSLQRTHLGLIHTLIFTILQAFVSITLCSRYRFIVRVSE